MIKLLDILEELSESGGNKLPKRLEQIIRGIYKRGHELVEDPDIQEIGEGAFAKVYAIKGTDYVLRLGGSKPSPYPQSIVDMKTLVNSNLEYVVNFMYYDKLQGGDYTEVMIMGRVDKLPSRIQQGLEFIFNRFEIAQDGGAFTQGFMNYYEGWDENMDKLASYFYGSSKEEVINYLQPISKYLDQIKFGINELKSVGIEHKDISPDNVMFDNSEDKIKLIDVT